MGEHVEGPPFSVQPYACGCGKCSGFTVKGPAGEFPRVFLSHQQAEILARLFRAGVLSWSEADLLLNGRGRDDFQEQVRRFAEHVAAHQAGGAS